MIYDGDAVWGG